MFKRFKKTFLILTNRLKSKNKGVNNEIFVDKKVNIKYSIVGSNNKLHIEAPCNVIINIFGNNNNVIIKNPKEIQKLKIYIGNFVPINNCNIVIDTNTTVADVTILGFSNNSTLSIGKDCLFSRNVQIRMGEIPHLIFDKESGEYLDKGSDIYIGDHCWIGEGVGIMKNASIEANNIVGFNSVVTKKFNKSYTVIAGNPAQVRKENVNWQRDIAEIKNKPLYKNAYDAYMNNN